MLDKDLALERLADAGHNIAQFVSFGPDGQQRSARVCGHEPDAKFTDFRSAVQAILDSRGPGSTVSIRSFRPEQSDGNPFFYGPEYGLHDAERAASIMSMLMSQGLNVIAHETFPTDDGSISGVLYGDVFEFSPLDIPRCVDRSDCAHLRREEALKLVEVIYRREAWPLKNVFGQPLGFSFPETTRLECTFFPLPVGYLGKKYVVWQAEDMPHVMPPSFGGHVWPNRMSRALGDKAYGLLMAYLHGFLVPWTRVFGRYLPYFEFGHRTGREDSPVRWIRTCPFEPCPGRFATVQGYADPFALMAKEDPSGQTIPSMLVQDGVPAQYSGAALTGADGRPVIEGCSGDGRSFMLGAAPRNLSVDALTAVRNLWESLSTIFGQVSFEWVFDGRYAWLVQLHSGQSVSSGLTIVPGTPRHFLEYAAEDGLEGLRTLIGKAQETNSGIVLYGNVGVTSHFGDILRRAHVPSRLERRPRPRK